MIRRIRQVAGGILLAAAAWWAWQAVRLALLVSPRGARVTHADDAPRPGWGYGEGAAGGPVALRIAPLSPAETARARVTEPIVIADAWRRQLEGSGGGSVS